MRKLRIDPSNPRTYERLKKEGRGQGVGEAYKPWLTVRDLSSLGESTRLTGWRTGRRLLHLFSKLERDFFYRLEWFEDVTDYREQFPLDLGLTLDIAEDLGLLHPRSRLTGRPMTMTTDFLVTRGLNGDQQLKAYYVKPAEDLELLNAKRPRHVKNNLAKLKIEQEYWQRHGVPHELATERDFNRVIATNVRAVHAYHAMSSVAPLGADEIEQVHAVLFPQVSQGQHPLSALTSACDAQLGHPAGTSLKVARHLLANRRWPVNFTVPFDPCCPLKLNV